MRTEKNKTAGKSRNRRSRTSRIIFGFTGACAAFYLATTLLLGSLNADLAVQNQTLLSDIETQSAAINRLEGEITELQEKNRVLGMLDGQVSDNGGNVYYYDAQ